MIDAMDWLREREARAAILAPLCLSETQTRIRPLKAPGLRRPCGCELDPVVFGHPCQEPEAPF
jgi:hypothetical protein